VFFSKQGDKIIVTKFLGEGLLGIYMIAWRFARIPELLTKPLPNALFPAYSKFQDNPKALKKKYIKTLRLISLLYIPLVGGMIVLARPFTSIFLGEKWIAAVLPMQILTFAIGISVIVYTSHSLFNAMGKTSFNFKVNLTCLLIMCIVVYPLVKNYGVVGAALCCLVMAVARIIVWKIEITKLIGFDIKDLSFLLFPIINTVFVIVVISLLGSWVNTYHLGVFISTIVFAAVVYFSMGFIFSRVIGFNIFHDLIATFQLLKLLKAEDKT